MQTCVCAMKPGADLRGCPRERFKSVERPEGQEADVTKLPIPPKFTDKLYAIPSAALYVCLGGFNNRKLFARGSGEQSPRPGAAGRVP